MLGVTWSLAIVYVSAIFSIIFLQCLPKSRHLALAFLIGGELLAVTLTEAPALVLAVVMVAYQFLSDVKVNPEVYESALKNHLYVLGILALAVLITFAGPPLLGIGYGLSLVYGLAVGYYALPFLPPGFVERAIPLWKALITVVVPLALLESFGLSLWVIPIVTLHYLITALWLKSDLWKMIKELDAGDDSHNVLPKRIK
ncbi:hypothetical protein [Thermococcus sp. 21S9]|uniref:hypothetical protein n=1 Tax=Thermococcus sp. 21S9 TaxID=1638223 RepID=UPI001438BCEB|nr:hypothetical protein [Thermococcus sp. 21S9]NJE54341.1 hypothetical protein [Thermococcus sp. 21S9]